MARLGTVITVLLVGVAGGVAVAAAGEPRIASQRFDDWFLRCVSPSAEKNEAKTQCEVVQIAKVKTTAKNDGGEVNLITLSVAELAQEGKKALVLTAIAPLNVYLPPGLELAAGEVKATLTYRNCNAAGCWSQHLLDDRTAAAFASAPTGLATVRLINGQTLAITFSLKGFKPALAALKRGTRPK